MVLDLPPIFVRKRGYYPQTSKSIEGGACSRQSQFPARRTCSSRDPVGGDVSRSGDPGEWRERRGPGSSFCGAISGPPGGGASGPVRMRPGLPGGGGRSGASGEGPALACEICACADPSRDRGKQQLEEPDAEAGKGGTLSPGARRPGWRMVPELGLFLLHAQDVLLLPKQPHAPSVYCQLPPLISL